MAVIFNDDVAKVQAEVDAHPKITLWYNRLHKYQMLAPFFPKDVEHEVKWWYRLGFTATIVMSVWFFILALYFIFLAATNKLDWFYLLMAGVWIIIGLVLPAGSYRATILILKRKKIIYD